MASEFLESSESEFLESYNPHVPRGGELAHLGVLDTTSDDAPSSLLSGHQFGGAGVWRGWRRPYVGELVSVEGLECTDSDGVIDSNALCAEWAAHKLPSTPRTPPHP